MFQKALDFKPESSGVSCIAFNENGQIVLAGSTEGVVRLYGTPKLVHVAIFIYPVWYSCQICSSYTGNGVAC